jgi:DNA-binding NarL/FixJ family response regulator
MEIKVYLVEDDRNLQENIRRFINLSPGFECVHAFCSGEELLAAEMNPVPNVVLMDINLPGMDGIECVGRLKQLKPEIQVLMLTVYENSDRIFEALAAGANGFLVKSTPPDNLLEAIRDVSNGGGPMSGHIARKVIQSFQPAPRNTSQRENLTNRELEILELLSQGSAYKQIAARLNLSMGTIQTHISRIYKKLHVNSRTQAVMKFLDVEPEELHTSSRPKP